MRQVHLASPFVRQEQDIIHKKRGVKIKSLVEYFNILKDFLSVSVEV